MGPLEKILNCTFIKFFKGEFKIDARYLSRYSLKNILIILRYLKCKTERLTPLTSVALL